MNDERYKESAPDPARRRLPNMAAAVGGAQFTQMLMGSTPAQAARGKPLRVAVVAQQMSAQSDPSALGKAFSSG
ncbi:MAG: hypothetical protein ABI478_06135 [Propionivibrio sp.]